MTDKKKKVVVLAGGESPEHDISLQSAMNVIRYLDFKKYHIHPSMITKEGGWILCDKPLLKTEQKNFEYNEFYSAVINRTNLRIGQYLDKLRKLDPALVFIMMHGPGGEDGKIQGMLDLAKIPYTGPSAVSCAAAMDKIITKLIIEQLGLDTPSYMVVHNHDWKNGRDEITSSIKQTLGLPVFIKAPDLGSSYGLGIADNEKEIIDLVETIFESSSRILIEKYIKGTELTVSILGNSSDGSARALPVIMIVPKETRFFDLEAKYDNTITDEIVPAPIDDAIRDKCQDEAMLIYYALGCDGLSRIDLIWADEKAHFLELNPLPGFTSASLYPKSAKAAGIRYPELLDKLIKFGLSRYSNR